MTACIPARRVKICLRYKRTDQFRDCWLVIPGTWSKSRLLAYCRREHPTQTVTIVTWCAVSTGDKPWDVLLWLPSPKEMQT